MHVAPIQKNLYTVHTQVYKGSNTCHSSQLDHTAHAAFLVRGIWVEGVGAEVSSTGNSWQVECVSPSETERPLPILDPFGERNRDKVCRKSTSVTTGRLPSWSSIGQTSHAPKGERERYSKCMLQSCEVLPKPLLLGRLPQLCELFRQVYS